MTSDAGQSGPSAGGQFDDAGYSPALSAPRPSSTPPQDKDTSNKAEWHAGLDLGLLAIRVILGGIFIVHGLQKLGMFGGMDGNGGGVSVFADALSASGYSATTMLAWVTTVTELGAGVLLVLGLFTALAGAGIVGVMTNAVIAMKLEAGFFAGEGGYEYEMMLGAAALALMFTGAGRVALDRRTRWFSHAPAFGLVSLILAAVATVVVLLVFR
ncbi:putative oxidoreductase [Tamaricihabitans halophyticus]|uniref:Putative oxidoreductase n=1 Tax=Tamaricihabitans halophyticus TaxID=1262583 RepID=A0A4R2QQR1_9PSEU|nr:DoxX family protein [Tamaricihabitans halophyticus]TCP52080.1 putative oxidoreductase [Tamaricihabitans halophyticus]